MNYLQLAETAERLFVKRSNLLNLWQDIAEQFYPERADFTVTRSLGETFADFLTTSYPLMVRRDLGNAISQMLRPKDKTWFRTVAFDDDAGFTDLEARAWLERSAKVQRKFMYDRASQFVRATKEGDHDFAAFGQCVISIELNRMKTGLLYRCWHLRDMAWAEDEEGKIGTIARRWKPTVRDLVSLFGADKVHPETNKTAERFPFNDADIRHIVVKSDMVDDKFSTPYVSIYYDAEHQHVIEKTGVFTCIYVIPRWQTVSGSQYAYSPATVAGLPDARLLQAMTYTLLEAGEKHTNPPMIAVQEAIRSDVSIYAGGITWVDAAYDEKMGEVLRPLTQDKSGMPLGIDMTRDIRAMLMEAFYLNKLNLPQRAPEMTAFEVSQRVQQYIRDALPLFEPMEMEYNGAVCEETFELLFRNGAFGSPLDLPPALRGVDVQFKFESPLHEAIEREKASRYMEGQQFIAQTVQVDPTAAYIINTNIALRDVLEGLGIPAEWTRSEEEVQEIMEQQQQVQNAQAMLSTMQQGADVTKTLAEASQASPGTI